MDLKIESPQGVEALTEFVGFHDQVYAYRDARWPAPAAFQLSVLMGENPFARGRRFCPFLARVGDRILARAVAIVETHYTQHWREPLGHVSLFEALPEARGATK